MTILSLSNVGVSYGKRDAVSDISLVAETGEWIGLIGPNGAGKSSLLRAIGGLVDYRGTIEFDGSEIDARDRPTTIALLPQNPTMPPGMSVGEYVLLGRTAHMSWLAAESEQDRSITIEAIDRLDLGSFVNRPVDQLSGGEAQRVALARALTQQSSILLLDEPTSALDIGHQLAVLDLVNEIRCERMLTVVAAMHDLTAAGRLADRLFLLGDGQLKASGTTEEVLTARQLEPVYATEVSILRAPDDSVVVVPMRSTS